MKLSRRLLSLVLCFSVCLIGCAVPALAVNTELFLSPVNSYGYVATTSTGSPVYEPFNEDWEVARTVDIEAGTLFNFYNANTIYERTMRVYCIYENSNRMDIVFSISGNDVQFSNAQMRSPSIVFFTNSEDFLGDLENGDVYWRSPGVQWEFWVDGVFLDSYYNDSSVYLPEGTFIYDGSVDSSIEIRAVTEAGTLAAALAGTYPACTGLVQIGLQEYYVGNISEYSEQFKIIFSKFDDVNENLEDVNTNLENVNDNLTVTNSYLVSIDGNVATIQQDVSDVKQQLETPSSNIWQAAGQTIKDAVTDLFVPTQQQITDVKQQFDELAQDKLGGAYTAMDTVDQTMKDLNDKLNAPSAQQGIEFPGISVPLGGDVGTVTIAPAQTVTLPTQLTSILHPVAGIIIPIIVGLGTFNTLKDLVECFLSGYSYSEYLHRNKGGGDE